MEVFQNITKGLQELSKANELQERILKSKPRTTTFLRDVNRLVDETAERVNKIITEKIVALNATVGYIEKLYSDLMKSGEIIRVCDPPNERSMFFRSSFFRETVVDLSSVSIVSLNELPKSSCINLKFATLLNNLLFTTSFPMDDILQESKQTVQKYIDFGDLILGEVSTTKRQANIYPRASYHSYIDTAIFSYPRIHSFSTKNNFLDFEQKEFSVSHNQITSTDTNVATGITSSKIHSAPYNFADVFFVIFLDDCDPMYHTPIIHSPELLKEQLIKFPAMFTEGERTFSYNLLSEQEIYQYDEVDDPGITLVGETVYINQTTQHTLFKTPLRAAVDIAQAIIEAKSDFSTTGIVFTGLNYLRPLKGSYKTFTGPTDVYLEFMNDMVRNVSIKNYCLMPSLYNLYEALRRIYEERMQYFLNMYRQQSPFYTQADGANYDYGGYDNSGTGASASAGTRQLQLDGNQVKPMMIYILGPGLNTNNQNNGESTSVLKQLKGLIAQMKKISIQISMIAIPPSEEVRANTGAFNQRVFSYEAFCWLRHILSPHSFHVFDTDKYIHYLQSKFDVTESINNMWFIHRNLYLRHVIEQYLVPLRSKNEMVHFSAPYKNLHGSYVTSMCKNAFVDINNLPKTRLYSFDYSPMIKVSQKSSKFIVGSMCIEIPLSLLLDLRGLAHKSYKVFLISKAELAVIGTNSHYIPVWQYIHWSVLDFLSNEALRMILLRKRGILALDLDSGYRVFHNNTIYDNNFNISAHIPTKDSPYPYINQTRYIFFREIADGSNFILLAAISRNMWDFPLAEPPKPSQPIKIDYLFCHSSVDSGTFYLPQTLFSKAYKDTGNFTYGLSRDMYMLPDLCNSIQQMVNADSYTAYTMFNYSLAGALGMNPISFHFARFAAANIELLQECYRAFNLEASGSPNSVLQCIFIDLAGNTMAYPNLKCTNIYNMLIQDLLGKPVSERVSFHRSPCICSVHFYDNDDPIILDSYDSYLYNFTCMAMAIRLYAHTSENFKHPEIVGFLIVAFAEDGLHKVYTKFKQQIVTQLPTLCSNFDSKLEAFSVNPISYLDLYDAEIYEDDFSSILLDREKMTNTHVIQMQYLLWYNGLLECRFKQYHDKVLRTMTAAKTLRSIYPSLILNKEASARYYVYARHLGNVSEVHGVKNQAVVGIFTGIHGISVDLTYMSLDLTPSIGCKRAVEESQSLMAYYPQTNTLNTRHNVENYNSEQTVDTGVHTICPSVERDVIFPIIIGAIFLVLFITLFKAILHRTAIKYRLQMRPRDE